MRGRLLLSYLCFARGLQHDISPQLHVSPTQSERRCLLVDCLDQPPLPYATVWQWQQATVAEQIQRLRDGRATHDTLIAAEHQPVCTLGVASSTANVRFAIDSPSAPFPVVRVERGGEVTYHGPGQIVLYPILDLRRHGQDLHAYLRSLEEVVIRATRSLGIESERVDGLTGVWFRGHKIAAVGVRVSRWVTMHGVSLNVDPCMDDYRHIVPCGIRDRPVGSLAQFRPGLDSATARRALLRAFEEVFDVRLEPSAELPLRAQLAGTVTSPEGAAWRP